MVQVERHSKELNGMKAFYRQTEGEARELLQNKGKDCFGPGPLILRGEAGQGAYANYFTSANQKFQIHY